MKYHVYVPIARVTERLKMDVPFDTELDSYLDELMKAKSEGKTYFSSGCDNMKSDGRCGGHPGLDELFDSEKEFLKESNAIEEEYSEESLIDAITAWKFARKNIENINLKTCLEIHRILMQRSNQRIAGKIRQCNVYIGGQKKEYTSVVDLESKLNYLFSVWNHYQSSALELKPDEQDSLESYIKEWHVKFEEIHPFEDGNGRVGRILLNMQRLNSKLPLLIIHAGEEQYEYYNWFKPEKPLFLI